MSTLTAKAVLEQNYLFRRLSEKALDQLASIALRRTYNKGTVIFLQGDEADALYGVASGRVRISASGADGKEVYLNIMEPGDTFGEIAVLDGLPRTAGATAIDATTLIVIHRPDFLELVQQDPQLSTHLIKLLCERLRWTSDLVEEAAFLNAEARLAKRLSSLASLHGRKTDNGTELDITQSDLAQFLSISRQIVNQHLQEWRAKAWVDLAPRKITVCDPDELARVVADAVSGSAR